MKLEPSQRFTFTLPQVSGNLSLTSGTAEDSNTAKLEWQSSAYICTAWQAAQHPYPFPRRPSTTTPSPLPPPAPGRDSSPRPPVPARSSLCSLRFAPLQLRSQAGRGSAARGHGLCTAFIGPAAREQRGGLKADS